MPSRTIDLTPDQDDFVSASVASGRYRDAGELLRAALDDLRWRAGADQADGDALRVALAAGLASLESGDFTDVGEDELDRYLDDLAAAPDRAS